MDINICQPIHRKLKCSMIAKISSHKGVLNKHPQNVYHALQKTFPVSFHSIYPPTPYEETRCDLEGILLNTSHTQF